MTPEEQEETRQQIRRLHRMLGPQPPLVALFPLFTGALGLSLLTTISMMFGPPLPMWRCIFQACFMVASSVFTVLSWKARRAWWA